MDNPTTLLVAIMYVTIVATGLVSALMALSDIVGGQRKTASIHTAWILLLLISYFGFFWETTAILDIEGWDFLSFLAFILGPIVLLFATNLIIAAPDVEGPDMPGEAPLDKFYFDLSARFFTMLALVQGWIIGLDVVFESITFATWLTACIGILFVALAVSRNQRVHVGGAVVVGLAFLSRMLLQAI
jgi:hypothetical protein